LQHHVIPATSAATERSFNVAGLICSDRRNRLEDVRTAGCGQIK